MTGSGWSAGEYLTHSRADDLRQYQLLNSTRIRRRNFPKAACRWSHKPCWRDVVQTAVRQPITSLTTDPRECWFGPEELLCAEGDNPSSCLTKEQINVVMKMYGQYIVVGTHIEIDAWIAGWK